jgi:hypothetical protein
MTHTHKILEIGPGVRHCHNIRIVHFDGGTSIANTECLKKVTRKEGPNGGDIKDEGYGRGRGYFEVAERCVMSSTEARGYLL